MKKRIAGLLSMLLVSVLIFTGCGASNGPSDSTPGDNAAEEGSGQKQQGAPQEESQSQEKQQDEQESEGLEEIPSLKEVYSDYFYIGAAIDTTRLITHRDLLTKHFNSLTGENQFKFSEVHPKEDQYVFDKTDSIMDFAETNGMQVRGHTLVWHNQTPDWVFKDESGKEVTREVLLQRMEDHIKTVVGRYKGRIYCWDVVNEAISDNGSEIYRKDSKWYQIIGEDYIEKAFGFAHEADPDAQLFYNDYNAIVPQKRDKIFNMIKALKDKGVPIDGVGIQGHWSLTWPSQKDIKDAIEKYASIGLKVQITELDLSFYGWNEKNKKYNQPPENLLSQQAKQYARIFEVCREHKEDVTGITFWGVADDHTWLDNNPVAGRKNWPLLFDTRHQPKEAFWSLLDFK